MNNRKNFGSKKGHQFRSKKDKKLNPDGKRVDDRDTQLSAFKVGPAGGYSNILKENPTFEAYYKAQKIVSNEEEWEQFIETMKKPLPSDFRISSLCTGQAELMRQRILNLTKLSNSSASNEADGQQQEEQKPAEDGDDKGEKKKKYTHFKSEFVVSPMPWYPNRLGWTINLSKIEIRKSEALNKLHHFLISETATGDISRQEAVSMIPPLLLQVKPGHSVLDMCAAPGSKTAQIIEMLHADSNMDFVLDTDGVPVRSKQPDQVMDGLVVANDVDNKRCYMLVHQSNRLHSPAVVITNHDASMMPTFYKTSDEGKRSRLKFDRVLADVPCSGDGTLRKNYDVWSKWNAANSNNFHHIQLKIARRGLELLAKDGLMAYSTCSLNPAEDEAVIAQLLKASEGSLELLDAASTLPELKSRPGLEHWTVMSRDGVEYADFESVPKQLQTQIRESLFPPTEAKELNLQRCIRVLPHYQNTGGFFIAILRKKTDRMPWEPEAKEEEKVKNENKPQEAENGNKQNYGRGGRKRVFFGHKEDPFFFLTEADPDWPIIKSFYQLPEHFKVHQLAHRCSTGKRRNLYFLTQKAANFVAQNGHAKIISGGCKMFARVDVNQVACNYRVTQEGIPSLFPFFVRRLDKYEPVVTGTEKVEETLSSEEKEKQFATSLQNGRFTITDLDAINLLALLRQEDVKMEQFSDDVRPRLDALTNGCAILYTKVARPAPNENSTFMVAICAWKGRNSIRAYVARNDKLHLMRLCGIEDPTFVEKAKQGQVTKKEDAENGNNDNEDAADVNEEDEKDDQSEPKKCKLDEENNNGD